MGSDNPAMESGGNVEELVAQLLKVANFNRIRGHEMRIGEVFAHRKGLFEETGCYARQVVVPLVAPCHEGKGRFLVADFCVVNRAGQTVLLSVKNQDSGGSCDEKLEYEIQRLRSAQYPAAMYVRGDGYRRHVLEEIWERVGHDVYLFRCIAKLAKWLQDGCPVHNGITTPSMIVDRYCDRTPYGK